MSDTEVLVTIFVVVFGALFWLALVQSAIRRNNSGKRRK